MYTRTHTRARTHTHKINTHAGSEERCRHNCRIRGGSADGDGGKDWAGARGQGFALLRVAAAGSRGAACASIGSGRRGCRPGPEVVKSEYVRGARAHGMASRIGALGSDAFRRLAATAPVNNWARRCSISCSELCSPRSLSLNYCGCVLP